MLLAVGFVLGLFVGFPLGVLAYLLTYVSFQKDNEQRTRKRIALASQQAALQARELANKLHRMRSMRGDQLNSNEQPNEELEEILGTGPQGKGR